MLEDGLNSLSELAINIYLDSIELFHKSDEVVEDYISSKEISVQDKLDDINEMIKFAEEYEMYEECSTLVKMRDRIND